MVTAKVRAREGIAWDDVRVPASAIRIGAASPPTERLWKTDGAGSTGIMALGFAAAAINQFWFDRQMPHDWKIGTNLHPHVHWSPPDDLVGTVRWGLEYTIASIKDGVNANYVFGNTTIIYVEELVDTQHDEHLLTEFAEIDMSAYEGVSVMIKCRLFRDATHVNDDYASEAYLHEFDFHYELDARGSRTEYTK